MANRIPTDEQWEELISRIKDTYDKEEVDTMLGDVNSILETI